MIIGRNFKYSGYNLIGSVGYKTKKVALIVDIAGRLGSNIRQTGDILINGRKQVLAYGTSVWK
jgi:hypothetical protein